MPGEQRCSLRPIEAHSPNKWMRSEETREVIYYNRGFVNVIVKTTVASAGLQHVPQSYPMTH